MFPLRALPRYPTLGHCRESVVPLLSLRQIQAPPSVFVNNVYWNMAALVLNAESLCLSAEQEEL